MKRALLILFGILLAGSWVQAEEAKTQDVSTYLQEMQVKLDHAAQRINQPSGGGSAVIGLRGSKQESAAKQLYWKGKTGAALVSPEEVKTFRDAVELALSGKKDEATAGLKSFLDKYPTSPLKSDATTTLALLTPVKP